MFGEVVDSGFNTDPDGTTLKEAIAKMGLTSRQACKSGQITDKYGNCMWPEQSTRPADITPVLDEHVTPPPAIISTPTVVPAEEKILGMDRKTAKIAGGIGAGLFLLLLFR